MAEQLSEPAAERVPGRITRRLVARSMVRVCVFTGVLFALFVQAPLDARPEGSVAVRLALSLLVFAGVVTWQIISVARSPYPALRAFEAVSISLPLLIFLFAATYVVMGQVDPASFTEPISRTDAVYFTVTVFASVGFGDIAAMTDAARIAVTIQMVLDLVLIGVIAKVLLGAVQQRRRALSNASTEQPAAATGTAPEESR